MPRRYAFFMLLQSTPRWRALDASEQHAHYDSVLMRVFEGYPDLRLRRFDSAAFAGRCSDVLLWETSDVAQYHDAIASLREAGLLSPPWFEAIDVIPAVEDTWCGFDDLAHPIVSEAF
jgi:hypothetical protein